MGFQRKLVSYSKKNPFITVQQNRTLSRMRKPIEFCNTVLRTNKTKFNVNWKGKRKVWRKKR